MDPYIELRAQALLPANYPKRYEELLRETFEKLGCSIISLSKEGRKVLFNLRTILSSEPKIFLHMETNEEFKMRERELQTQLQQEREQHSIRERELQTQLQQEREQHSIRERELLTQLQQERKQHSM